MKTIAIHSLEQTKEFARKLVENIDLEQPFVLALSGELGAGKTTLTKAIAKELGIKQVVNSPTFTILKSYPFKDQVLHHIDAYRLEGAEQELGLEECFDSFCVVEWPQYLPELQDQDYLEIAIHQSGPEERVFELSSHGARAQELEERL